MHSVLRALEEGRSVVLGFALAQVDSETVFFDGASETSDCSPNPDANVDRRSLWTVVVSSGTCVSHDELRVDLCALEHHPLCLSWHRTVCVDPHVSNEL